MKKNTENLIEALLFYATDGLTLNELKTATDLSGEELTAGLQKLKTDLSNRGINLVSHGEVFSLATSPDCAEAVLKVAKDLEQKDLSKPALETLSVILYLGEAKRSEIELSRGVNSAIILRNLLLRGLIEKKNHGGLESVYVPSKDLIHSLGLSEISALPDFEMIKKELSERILNQTPPAEEKGLVEQSSSHDHNLTSE